MYGLVRQSGGSVSVESDLDQGTTFTILLPKTEASKSKGAQAIVEPERGRAAVLVAEDNDDIRELAVDVLTDAGYTVSHAPNGVEALDL